jgi:4-amino-4-deoxy-L-arabinose transferase-like glycosyltransferase
MLIPWTVLIPTFLGFGKWRNTTLNQPVNSDTGTINANQPAWRNYLLAWGLMPAVFFTFASNIIMPYVLPGIPALSLLGGYYLVRKDPRVVDRLLATGLSIVLIISLLFIVIFPITGYGERISERTLIHYYQSQLAKGSLKDTSLVYLGQYPYSASFYSNGGLSDVSSTSALVERLGKEDLLVVAIGNDQDPKDDPLIKDRLKKVKSFRRYTLYSEIPDLSTPATNPQG